MGAAVNNGENHEALGALGAVLGATMVGIDKSNQSGAIIYVCYVIILLKTMAGMSFKISPIKVLISVVVTGMISGMKCTTMYCFIVSQINTMTKGFERYPVEYRTFYKSDSVMGNNYGYFAILILKK